MGDAWKMVKLHMIKCCVFIKALIFDNTYEFSLSALSKINDEYMYKLTPACVYMRDGGNLHFNLYFLYLNFSLMSLCY